MEACSKAARNKIIAHSSTSSNKRTLDGGLSLDFSLNFKEESHNFPFYNLIEYKPLASHRILDIATAHVQVS